MKNILVFPCGSEIGLEIYKSIKPESLNKITELKIMEKFIDVTCDAKLNESSEKFIKWIFA